MDRFMRQGFVRIGARIVAVANLGRHAGNMSFALAVPCPASRRRPRQTGRVRGPPNRQPTSGAMENRFNDQREEASHFDMKPKADKPGIKDVATRAGVSLGSVSRVINKVENVSPELRQRVLHAIAELDYRLNHAAQTLRSRSSRTIGCMFTDVTNPLYANLYRIYEERFRADG